MRPQAAGSRTSRQQRIVASQGSFEYQHLTATHPTQIKHSAAVRSYCSGRPGKITAP